MSAWLTLSTSDFGGAGDMSALQLVWRIRQALCRKSANMLT